MRKDESRFSGTRNPPLSPEAYWERNLRYLLILLAVWFAGSFGAGILLAPLLDRVRIPGTGFPMGFWFAQQGAIYAFLLVIVAVQVERRGFGLGRFGFTVLLLDDAGRAAAVRPFAFLGEVGRGVVASLFAHRGFLLTWT